MARMRAAIFIPKGKQDVLVRSKIAALTAYASSNRYTIVRRYFGQLNMLLHDSRLGRWDILLFCAPADLASRGIAPSLHIFSRLKAHGRMWHCLDLPLISNDESTSGVGRDTVAAFMAALRLDMARSISKNTKAALAKRRAQGVKLGRHPKGCRCDLHAGKVVA